MAREKDEVVSPKPFSTFRLVLDKARLTPEVIAYRYRGSGTAEDPFVVVWIPNDPGNPFNWSKKFRWIIVWVGSFSVLATAFASSAFSGTLRELNSDLHASTELAIAGIALFVLGFGVGPLVWAPVSEMYGRQIVWLTTFSLFTVFNAACAGANSIGSLLVFRFLAGSTGASPLTNAGGIIADVFPAAERGLAMSTFALAPSLGPTIGPFIAGFLSESQGWRWALGLLAIVSGCSFILGTLIVPETYAPVILRRRATLLSKMTGKVYKIKADIENGDLSFKSVVKTAMVRPWILLFLEPIVLFLSIYLSIVYGTLYLLFGAFPIVFQETRGWSEGVGGLAFLGVAVGMLLAGSLSPLFNKWYQNSAAKHGGIAPPEERLHSAMIGAVAVPVGMFWFAWTNSPNIHWIVPIMAGAPFGFGMNSVFLSINNYLVDAYTIFAASALAANAILRSMFGAAFPLFTNKMYDRLGIHWASSVPAFLALACMPFPFLFYKYGARIRKHCVYATEAEAAMQALRARAEIEDEEEEDGDERASAPTSRPSSDVANEVILQTRLDDEKDLEAQYGRPRPTTSLEVPASNKLTRVHSKGESMIEAAAYDASPYDIDRVNTNQSVSGLELSKVRSNR